MLFPPGIGGRGPLSGEGIVDGGIAVSARTSVRSHIEHSAVGPQHGLPHLDVRDALAAASCSGVPELHDSGTAGA